MKRIKKWNGMNVVWMWFELYNRNNTVPRKYKRDIIPFYSEFLHHMSPSRIQSTGCRGSNLLNVKGWCSNDPSHHGRIFFLFFLDLLPVKMLMANWETVIMPKICNRCKKEKRERGKNKRNYPNIIIPKN